MWKKLLSVRWIITTLFVILAVGTMVRLGFWQLDRLDQRRAFIARVQAQLEAPLLNLNEEVNNLELVDMEYRSVTVSGEYNHSEQMVLRNRVWNGQPGVDLLTPLLIDGTDQAVIVNRGWIPLADLSPERWAQYDEPGKVTVHGVVRSPQAPSGFGRLPDPELEPGQTRLDTWNFVNLERIDQQVSTPLLPVYVQQSPVPNWMGPPMRTQPELDLTEGSHQGYALQWFSFAAVLMFGYPFFVSKTISNRKFINE